MINFCFIPHHNPYSSIKDKNQIGLNAGSSTPNQSHKICLNMIRSIPYLLKLKFTPSPPLPPQIEIIQLNETFPKHGI